MFGIATLRTAALRRIRRRREPAWRRAHIWVPAPQTVVGPSSAGVDPDQLCMPREFDRLAAPPVFICGCARSGTTWLFDIFDRHPAVLGVCESWVLTQTHGLTSLLSQPYWDTAVRASWEQRVDMPFGAVQLMSYEQMHRDVSRLVAGWLMQPARDEHRFLVAKEPLDVRATAILFPTARFIHIIRDGREVALSMRRASETWDPTMGVDLPMEFRAEAWRRQVENVRAHRDLLGDRYLEVRYEDLRVATASTMNALFDFADIPCDDALLIEIAKSTDISRYDSAVRQSGFRGVGLNRGWRTDFSARDAIGFHRAAGELLLELGYERDWRWWLAALRRPKPSVRPRQRTA